MKNYKMRDLIFGFNSTLIADVNSMNPLTTNYTDKTWIEGDAIRWSTEVAPIISSNTTNALNLKVEVKSDVKEDDLGRLTSINNLEYPNQQREVLLGNGSFAMLPFKCSDLYINFTNEGSGYNVIYSWM